jgi:hypothetical protein
MPPSIIDQIREQQAWEQPKKSSPVRFIVGTVAAFGVGVLVVVAWGGLPALSIKGLGASQPKTMAVVTHLTPSAPAATSGAAPAAAKQADVSIPARGRLGDASESNLLRTCIPGRFSGGLQKKDIYNLLQTSSQMMSIASITGAQQNIAATGAKGFSILWAEVADCVFRQNGYALCDPDNRALAVEAVTAFVRQSAIAAAPEQDSEFNKAMATLQGPRRQALEHAMYRVRATRERVLETLKMRAQEGRFIASDFGFFAPGEVTAAVKSAKPTGDACANKT